MSSDNKGPGKRLAAVAAVVLACALAAAVCACSSHVNSTRGDANVNPQASPATSPAAANATARPAGHPETPGAASAGALDFTLVNLSSFNLYAIYVSPHDSEGWEENLLGRDRLLDGEIVKIRFSPEEQAVMWDVRVEDENGNNAEWKNLNLREISTLTLREGEGEGITVIAEAE